MSKHRRTRPARRALPAPLPAASSPPPLPPPPPRPPTPERLLIDQIASGAIDEHLPQVAQAVYARLHLIETIQSLHALSTMAPGDHVRFNDQVRPRYLAGVHATILKVDETKATVRIDQSARRFTRGDIHHCPPLILERIDRSAA